MKKGIIFFLILFTHFLCFSENERKNINYEIEGKKESFVYDGNKYLIFDNSDSIQIMNILSENEKTKYLGENYHNNLIVSNSFGLLSNISIISGGMLFITNQLNYNVFDYEKDYLISMGLVFSGIIFDMVDKYFYQKAKKHLFDAIWIHNNWE